MWPEFVEVQHLSQITELWSTKTWDILTHQISLAFYGTMLFSVLGAWGITKNIQKISREGAKTVPLDWEIMFLGMFVTMFPYGFERESLALVIQCFFRIPFYLVLVWYVYKDHGGATKQETLVALAMVGAIIWSIFNATLVATVLL